MASNPPPLYLAPHGVGTEVLWVKPHGDESWEYRKAQIGIPKEQVEYLLITQTPLKPDKFKDDRLGRINRLVRLPNKKRLLAALQIVRVATPTKPGAIEIVTLYVE